MLMAVLIDIAVTSGALAIPVALLDRWLAMRARRRHRDAVDAEFGELLSTHDREGAGTRTARG
jgi:hypothetical protein